MISLAQFVNDYLLVKGNSKKTKEEIVLQYNKVKNNSTPCLSNATDFSQKSVIVISDLILKIRDSIEKEKKRRSVKWEYIPYSSWVEFKPKPEIIEEPIYKREGLRKVLKGYTKIKQDSSKASSNIYLELFDRINSLGSISLKNRTEYENGKIISKEDIDYLTKALNVNEMACLCDCNYCTCDCNYCTCNCNYCTCNCNYYTSLGKFGISGKKSSKQSTKDYSSFDRTVISKDETIWALSYGCTCDCNYCTCDCNYCTCNCNYCTCDCNYCTCDCNYCTCDCNYCTCDCNNSSSYTVGLKKLGVTDKTVWDKTSKSTTTKNKDGKILAGSYCTCDCNYCTCDCNYCTCDCNYCTCDCNYCTCDCNYCTCNCNQRICWGYYCWIDKK